MAEPASLRRSVWTSSLITLGALALFVAVAAFVPSPRQGLPLLLLGVFLAVTPALVWLAFFYQRDRAEPEPKPLVVRAFVFGAIAAAVLAAPTIAQATGPASFDLPNVWLRLLVNIFSIGLLQETLKLAMVRYVVLGTNEFNRHPDGIIYGMATGLGFATVLTLDFVVRSGGVLPLAGAISAVVNVLVHGTLGAFTGYYIGRVKIDGKDLAWMARGLLVAAVANGLYQTASQEVTRLGLGFNPWYGLGVAALLAAVVGGILFAMFQRAYQRATGALETVSIQIHARSKRMPWDIHVRYDLLLVGALIVGLSVGWGASAACSIGTMQYTSSELPVRFDYPSEWWQVRQGEGELAIQDARSQAAFKPTFSLTASKVRQGATLESLAHESALARENVEQLYHIDAREAGLQVDGLDAMRVRYTYVTQAGGAPQVVSGVETLVLHGNRLYTFRFESERDSFEQGLALYERIMQTVRFDTSS
jgi:RsiW-degrading membrane proteinase PrsW (M82 family)